MSNCVHISNGRRQISVLSLLCGLQYVFFNFISKLPTGRTKLSFFSSLWYCSFWKAISYLFLLALMSPTDMEKETDYRLWPPTLHAAALWLLVQLVRRGSHDAAGAVAGACGVAVRTGSRHCCIGVRQQRPGCNAEWNSLATSRRDTASLERSNCTTATSVLVLPSLAVGNTEYPPLPLISSSEQFSA